MSPRSSSRNHPAPSSCKQAGSVRWRGDVIRCNSRTAHELYLTEGPTLQQAKIRVGKAVVAEPPSPQPQSPALCCKHRFVIGP